MANAPLNRTPSKPAPPFFPKANPNVVEAPPSLAAGDVSDLFDRIASTLRTYVVMDEHQVVAATLWIAMTHVCDGIKVCPLALITAPEKACGKSQLLTIFGRLVANPLAAANCSPSFIFRSIEKQQPTLLIDEADTFFKENSELKGIINAGYTRENAFVGRTESDGNGRFEPVFFNVWCAKALAGIAMDRHLPAATQSRCIKILMRRKMPTETVSRLRHAAPEVFTELAARLCIFGKNHTPVIKLARPELPDELSDRDQDNWESLIAVAECAGPDWRARAVNAAIIMAKSGCVAVETGNELLEDIRRIFEMKRVRKISTEDLIKWLIDDSEAPWKRYNRGFPITARQLAKLLASYDPNIKSKTVRMGPHDTPKGYELLQFSDAFARYLPSAPPSDSDTEYDHFKDLEPPELLASIRDIDPTYARGVSSPKPDDWSTPSEWPQHGDSHGE